MPLDTWLASFVASWLISLSPGAAYLVWLGIQQWREPTVPMAVDAA